MHRIPAPLPLCIITYPSNGKWYSPKLISYKVGAVVPSEGQHVSYCRTQRPNFPGLNALLKAKSGKLGDILTFYEDTVPAAVALVTNPSLPKNTKCAAGLEKLQTLFLSNASALPRSIVVWFEKGWDEGRIQTFRYISYVDGITKLDGK